MQAAKRIVFRSGTHQWVPCQGERGKEFTALFERNPLTGAFTPLGRFVNTHEGRKPGAGKIPKGNKLVTYKIQEGSEHGGKVLHHEIKPLTEKEAVQATRFAYIAEHLSTRLPDERRKTGK